MNFDWLTPVCVYFLKSIDLLSSNWKKPHAINTHHFGKRQVAVICPTDICGRLLRRNNLHALWWFWGRPRACHDTAFWLYWLSQRCILLPKPANPDFITIAILTQGQTQCKNNTMPFWTVLSTFDTYCHFKAVSFVFLPKFSYEFYEMIFIYKCMQKCWRKKSETALKWQKIGRAADTVF